MTDLSIQACALLFGAAFLGGFVDSIAGGGGIITIPALLAVGIPPHVALGTNKLQASFGSFTAALNYRRGGMVRGRDLFHGILFTAIGAFLGTTTIQAVSADILEHVIPILLLVIFVYMLRSPELGATHQPHKMRPLLFYFLFGRLIWLAASSMRPMTSAHVRTNDPAQNVPLGGVSSSVWPIRRAATPHLPKYKHEARASEPCNTRA